uniref:Ripening-induced polygalacturonase 4 n=1 Tax=Carica papaya TaxID=3649 RepID=C9EA47_CARPA|nr:ripening-induced polygalacturonase 4 [Carica papaya]
MANLMVNSVSHIIVVIIIFIFFFFCIKTSSASPTSTRTFNVVHYGAKPDGLTDSTKAFIAAWHEACSSINPATIYVPVGKFLLHNAVFQGKCKNNISIRIEGTLVAPPYKVTKFFENWVLFEGVNGVSIFGGILDGQGASLWACKKSHKGCPKGATTLRFKRSSNIELNGVTSVNSQLYHIVIEESYNVKVQGAKVSASGDSPNTDGIHVQLSKDITIFDSRIATGDDCISVGPGTTNLWIENIACGPGHGISIGSLGKELKEAGVEDVTVKSVRLSGTKNGLRIKTWGRPSSGYARNIHFQNVVMNKVKNPIIIDQQYCPDKHCPHKSGIKISEITYENIHGTSATKVGIMLDCSSEQPCSGIRMEDVNLTYEDKPAQASCINANIDQ